MSSRRSDNPIVLALMFGVCFGLAQAALTFATVPDGTTVIWPASGLGLAAVFVLGSRIWPAVASGVFAAHLAVTGALVPALAITAGTVFEALAGALLIQRAAGGTDVFRRPRTIFRFTGIICATCAIGGGIVAIGLAIAGTEMPVGLAFTWMTASLSHVTGTLVLAPFVLLWIRVETRWPRFVEALEAVGLLAFLLTIALVVFGGRFPTDVKTYPLEFLCVPVFIWAAFRFGRREAASAIAILAAIVVWGTLRGYGPFVQATLHESFLLVQVYICVMSLTGLVLAAVVAEHKDAEAKLHELATTDPLTGLANYRQLIESLRAEIARSSRSHRPFAVLFLDMNGLKRINDEYGHLVGSRALCRVAETIQRSCRVVDTPARFGGDEFAVVLPDTTREGAEVVLSRVNARLATDTVKPPLSVSAGIAEYPIDGDTPTLLLRAADQALYGAKGETRSRAPIEPLMEERVGA